MKMKEEQYNLRQEALERQTAIQDMLSRISRLDDRIHNRLAVMATSEDISTRDLIAAKRMITQMNQLADGILSHIAWLENRGFSGLLTLPQRDALDYLAREVCHNLNGTLNMFTGGGDKKTRDKNIASLSAEMSKHIHVAITSRPIIGDIMWAQEDTP